MPKRPIIVWGKGGMPTDCFNYNDGGRLQSKRPREDNDCTVRAVAIAFGVSYDTAYDFFKLHGRKPDDGYHITDLFYDYLQPGKLLFGHTVTKIPFQAKKGHQRMYMAAFCHIYPRGVYILRLAYHVSTCLDGIINDTWWEPTDMVYTAYKISYAKASKDSQI